MTELEIVSRIAAAYFPLLIISRIATEGEISRLRNRTTLTITIDEERFQIPKRDARKRGVKLRYITEITKDNLSYCKRQLDLVDEMRHLNNVKGNFVMSDSEFIASHEISPRYPITEGFYSNIKKIVKLEGYIFETFWENAIPAVERISQLEAASGTYSRSPDAIEKEQKKKAIDRFYVCKGCNTVFIFVEDMKEHQLATGHSGVKEFSFFDK